MLSIEQCRKILQRHGKHYSNEEVRQIRDLLYQLGYLDYEDFKEQQNGATGDHLHEGFDRRTSGEGL
jgi:hypothetical protein